MHTDFLRSTARNQRIEWLGADIDLERTHALRPIDHKDDAVLPANHAHRSKVENRAIERVYSAYTEQSS